jgi:hypothetical protein
MTNRIVGDNDKQYIIPSNSIKYSDSPNLDAFGRLRTSELYTIFDSKSISQVSDVFFDMETSGGSINYLQNESSRDLVVTGGTGSYAILQTKRSFNYLPGKSQMGLFTGILSIEEDIIKRVGLFDSLTGATFQPNNGLYFETDGESISVNVIKNVTGLTKIKQSLWNLDTLDGSNTSKNPSGYDLDLTKSQIFLVDFEWLGVGRIRFGFNIDGKTIYCHEILNANNIEGVYMAYPNLPVRYEIRSLGGDGSLRQICTSVSSEGGFQANGIIRDVETISSLSIANGVNRPILAIRLKEFSRNIEIIPLILSAYANDEGDFIWRLKYYEGNETINRNGTPTQWSSIVFTGLTKSNIEHKNNFLTTDTVIAGQGISIGGGVVNAIASQGSSTGGANFVFTDIKNALLLGSKINGIRDVLCLEIQNVGTTDVYRASIVWREL